MGNNFVPFVQTQMIAYLELYAQHHGLDQYIRSGAFIPSVQIRLTV